MKTITSEELLNIFGLKLGDRIIVNEVKAKIVYNDIGGFLLEGITDKGYIFSQRITYLIDREWSLE